MGDPTGYLDEGKGLPWITMDGYLKMQKSMHNSILCDQSIHICIQFTPSIAWLCILGLHVAHDHFRWDELVGAEELVGEHEQVYEPHS